MMYCTFGFKQHWLTSFQKSLKIPDVVKSDAVNQKRTENIMTKKEKNKSINNDLQNTTQETKD